jgi:GAF domain-containing protein
MAAIDALFSAALRTFMDLHKADFGNVQIVDFQHRRKVLLIRAHSGFPEVFLRQFARVSAEDECACGRALKSGRSVHVSDTEADEAFARFRGVARATGFRAVVSTPIRLPGGESVGCLSAHFATPRVLNDEVIQRGELFASNLAGRIVALLEPMGERSPRVDA